MQVLDRRLHRLLLRMGGAAFGGPLPIIVESIYGGCGCCKHSKNLSKYLCDICIFAHLAYFAYIILPGYLELFNLRDAYVWHSARYLIVGVFLGFAGRFVAMVPLVMRIFMYGPRSLPCMPWLCSVILNWL